MNILFAGGVNSEFVKDQLAEKFSGGTIEMFAENTLSDVVGALVRGEKFDRILIAEKAWKGLTEEEFRTQLEEYSAAMVKHLDDSASALFICENWNDGKIIYEEILSIYRQCRILHLKDNKKSKLTVKLLSDFVTKDLDSLVDYFYNPDVDILRQREESEKLNFSTENILGGHLHALQEIDPDNLDIEEEEEEFDAAEADDSSFDDDFDEESEEYDMEYDPDNFKVYGDEEEDEQEQERFIGDVDDDYIGSIDHIISTPFRDVEDTDEDGYGHKIDSLYNEETVEEKEEQEDPLNTGFEFEEEQVRDTYYKEQTEEEQEGEVGDLDDFREDNLDEVDTFEEKEELTEIDSYGLKEKEEDLFEDETANKKELGDIGEEWFNSDTFQTKEENLEEDLEEDLEEERKSVEKMDVEESQRKKKPKMFGGKKYREGKAGDDFDEKSLRKILASFSGRGISMVVTGTSNSGKTMCAYNMANVLNRLGCSVLLVDLDLEKAGLSMISQEVYTVVHSLEAHSKSLKRGINTVTSQVKTKAVVLKPAFHLLTTGIGSLPMSPAKLVEPHKISRFGTSIKNNYNVIIYDIPFKTATEYFTDLLGISDFLINTVNFTTKSLQEFMIQMSSVEDEEVMDILFDRSQIIWNQVNFNLSHLFGKKVKNYRGALQVMDKEVERILGFQQDYLFQDMYLSAAIPVVPNIDSYYLRGQLSDSENGDALFRKIVKNILLREDME